jgi:hypothetical protein
MIEKGYGAQGFGTLTGFTEQTHGDGNYTFYFKENREYFPELFVRG